MLWLSSPANRLLGLWPASSQQWGRTQTRTYARVHASGHSLGVSVTSNTANRRRNVRCEREHTTRACSHEPVRRIAEGMGLILMHLCASVCVSSFVYSVVHMWLFICAACWISGYSNDWLQCVCMCRGETRAQIPARHCLSSGNIERNAMQILKTNRLFKWSPWSPAAPICFYLRHQYRWIFLAAVWPSAAVFMASSSLYSPAVVFTQ